MQAKLPFNRRINANLGRRRFDWRRRDVKDAIVISMITVVVFIVAVSTDLYETIDAFVLAHDEWFLDDLMIVAALMSVAMLVYGYRRLTDLSREIGARSEAQLEAHRLARHDPLTGLPNRRYFGEMLEEALAGLSTGEQAAVLMLDLDGFKAINDTHGHVAGDRALVEVAELLSGLLYDADLARLGGDEFAIILRKVHNRDDVAAMARRVVASFSEPITIGNVSVALGVSVGIAIAPDDGDTHDLLVRRSDVAMYRAKVEGRSLISFYEPQMDAEVERRSQTERALRLALAHDAIVPHYQPLVCLDGNKIVGFETLARWHDTNGPVPPDYFIPIAEEAGLIGQLGDQLLSKACTDACTWPRDLFLAFNLSAVQLRDPTAGLRILAILAKTGLDPRRLELEITETALLKNIDVAQKTVDELRAAGVRIALDDFGTGYATLTQLMSLHVDKLKIDKSFVDRLGHDPESLIVVRAILGLAKGFGLTTVAEGIEDDDQRNCLKENGCVEGQGYLFSKAVPANEVADLLRSRERLLKVA